VQPKLKDAEQEQMFQDLFGMYPTAGWRRILEDMVRLAEFYNRVTDVDTVEQLWFRRGQMDIIHQILTHQDRMEAAHAHALQEQEGTAEAPTGGRAVIVDPMS
jgi:hypothetical protein